MPVDISNLYAVFLFIYPVFVAYYGVVAYTNMARQTLAAIFELVARIHCDNFLDCDLPLKLHNPTGMPVRTWKILHYCTQQSKDVFIS